MNNFEQVPVWSQVDPNGQTDRLTKILYLNKLGLLFNRTAKTYLGNAKQTCQYETSKTFYRTSLPSYFPSNIDITCKVLFETHSKLS